ncbi:MAG TPA: transposase [Puia sp.]|nr:transposase [Puia sp.]
MKQVAKALKVSAEAFKNFDEEAAINNLAATKCYWQSPGLRITRWDKLMIYTTDGKLNIDNNPVENTIRPVAVGRNNYLFAGRHEAAQRSTTLYSLLGTCKLYDINPFERMKSVLEKIPAHRINKVADLLPHRWAAAQ